ncbi:hypothetical protein NDU88_005575 [Pleurodeles waltl]|uniref:Uncharacterized protein n=1 Tax=Pleurodeles waltl TaxID=8319 RepID=A0AAV7QGC8_PLEWA|nr:hypothetical protein NDU88_005575 [Pleurodeles waltl]
MDPELQILPAILFLLLYQEHQRRRRRPRWAVAGGPSLGSWAVAGGALLGSWAVAGGALLGSWAVAGAGLLCSEDGAGSGLLGSEDGAGAGLLGSEDGAGAGLLGSEDGAGGALLGSRDDGGLFRLGAPSVMAPQGPDVLGDGTPNILLMVGAALQEMYRGRREVITNCAVKAPSTGTCEEMAESSSVPTAGGPVDNGGKKFDYHLQV